MLDIYNFLQPHLTFIIILAGALGILVPSKARRWFFGFLRRFKEFIFQDSMKFKQEVRNAIEKTPVHDIKIAKIEYALNNDGKTGLVTTVAKLVSRDSQIYKRLPFPAFECDGMGHNTRVSDAYLKLIGLNRVDGLTGGGWQNVIYGELKEDYISGFRDSVREGIDYYGVVDFQNPTNGEHRGRWRLYLEYTRVADQLIYSGNFETAMDYTAKHLTDEYGWDIDINIPETHLFD